MASGCGMTLGTIIYLLGQKKYLGDYGLVPTYKPKVKQHETQPPLTKKEKHRIAVIFIMMFFTIFFWMAFEQKGSSLMLFAYNDTNRIVPLLNWEMPATWFLVVNPMIIVILAPVFAKLWVYLSKKKANPPAPIKFAVGLSLLGLGFILMMFAARIVETTGGKVGVLWLIFVYLFHTLGELSLSPVGLSLVSKLSPARFASLMFGVWLMSSAIAHYSSGVFAGNYDTMNHVKFFMIPAAMAFGAAFFLVLLSKQLKRWMHGADEDNV
jgi:POT family proton-dependent oligopeptide transporter